MSKPLQDLTTIADTLDKHRTNYEHTKDTLRPHILHAINEGHTIDECAQAARISTLTIQHWTQAA